MRDDVEPRAFEHHESRTITHHPNGLTETLDVVITRPDPAIQLSIRHRYEFVFLDLQVTLGDDVNGLVPSELDH